MDTRFTITMAPGVVKDDSAYATKGRYVATSMVRSWKGKMQKWGGWGNYFDVALTEPARGGLVWNTNDGAKLATFGTANKLWLIYQGAKYDITPEDLPAGNISFATGVDTGYGSDGYGEGPYGGSWSSVSGQGAFPRVWTMGRWGEDLVCNPRGGMIYFWDYSEANIGLEMTGSAGAAATTVTSLSNAAGINVGDRVTGTNIPDDTFVDSVNVGASTMVISNPTDGIISAGTLTFTTPAVTINSLTADTMVPTAALAIFVSDDRHLVVLGAAQDPFTYDALNVAWCNREDFTVWTPSELNTAGAIRCESGNQIMGACKVFGGWLIVTDLSAHAFTYQGGDDIWGLDRIGSTGGAISPQAIIEVDGIGYWMGPHGFFSYNGRVVPVNCDVHKALFDNVNRLQAYKICAGTNRRFGEIIWFGPFALTGQENDSYVAVNTFDSTWTTGGAMEGEEFAFSRTTWIDSHNLFETPLGLDGVTFQLFQHESGTTADGAAFPYLLETSELELKAEGGSIMASDTFLRLKKIIPDFAYVSGAHSLTILARGYQQDDAREKGPYDIGADRMFNPKARGRTFRFRQEGTGDFRLGDSQAFASPDGGRR